MTNKKSNILIYRPLTPAKTTEVFDSYWEFAFKRQEVFFKRFDKKDVVRSTDPIIKKYRFTNTYRAADRVSQYLIKNVIYNEDLPSSPKEVLFRILLFKIFNKIDTWELLESSLGPIVYESFDFEKYNKLLLDALENKETIYSAAYIMPSVLAFGYKRKHSNHLALIQKIIDEDTAERLRDTNKMQDAFKIIKNFPGLGDFLAYQFLIDINYSNVLNFSESEFVVPGPGAKGGISKCFSDTGGLNESEIIRLMVDRQHIEFERMGFSFKNLWGRDLQLIDCQNIFCEVDKYSRVKHPDIKGSSDRIRIKQVYKSNASPLDYWFPPKWGINENIK